MQHMKITENLGGFKRFIYKVSKPGRMGGNFKAMGTIGETFFYKQLRTDHLIESYDIADFFVNRKYTLEIGGKSKTRKPIAGVINALIAADNIEYSQINKIPLWLFGFLY